MSHRGILLDSPFLTARATLAACLLLIPLVGCGSGGSGGRPDIDLPPTVGETSDSGAGVPEPVIGMGMCDGRAMEDDLETYGHDGCDMVACGGNQAVEESTADGVNVEAELMSYIIDPVACDNTTDSCCVDSDTIFGDSAGGWDLGVKCYKGETTCPAGPTGMPTARGTCDGPEDCGEGLVCCINIVESILSCVSRESCDSSGLVICHTEDDCAPGESCDGGSPFPWWANCS